MAKTCCPTGKVYDSLSGLCTDLNKLNGTDPIDCPCCPPGYVYDSLTGLCATVTAPVITTSTIDCPCCPDGFVWYNFLSSNYPDGICAPPGLTVFSNAETYNVPIPCLPCDCTPAPAIPCTDCGSDGLPITFAYDPMVKNCTDCEPQDENPPSGGIQDFLPPQFQDPIISTFRLRNKNFI